MVDTCSYTATLLEHMQLHCYMHLVEGLSLVGIPAVHEPLDRLRDCHNYLFWPGTRPLIRHARRLSVVSEASTVSTVSTAVALSVVSIVSTVQRLSVVSRERHVEEVRHRGDTWFHEVH